MKHINILYLLASIVLFGCDETQPLTPALSSNYLTASTTYTIPAGAHYSNQSKYAQMPVGSLKFRAFFDNSAIYLTKDAKNQADINKLYGASDCGTAHQTNSARFGWVWNNRLEIWAYIYTNGQRKLAFVDSVSLNAFNTYEISFTDTSYIFKVNHKAVELLRHCNGPAHGYMLYPYFGGDEPAPHEVTIIIEDLN